MSLAPEQKDADGIPKAGPFFPDCWEWMVFSGTTWVVCPGEYVEREIVLETFGSGARTFRG